MASNEVRNELLGNPITPVSVRQADTQNTEASDSSVDDDTSDEGESLDAGFDDDGDNQGDEGDGGTDDLDDLKTDVAQMKADARTWQGKYDQAEADNDKLYKMLEQQLGKNGNGNGAAETDDGSRDGELLTRADLKADKAAQVEAARKIQQDRAVADARAQFAQQQEIATGKSDFAELLAFEKANKLVDAESKLMNNLGNYYRLKVLKMEADKGGQKTTSRGSKGKPTPVPGRRGNSRPVSARDLDPGNIDDKMSHFAQRRQQRGLR